MKKVVLLGSTGSIGTSTVMVAEDLPEQIQLIGLAAGGNSDLLLKQALRHRPGQVSTGPGVSPHFLHFLLSCFYPSSVAHGL